MTTEESLKDIENYQPSAAPVQQTAAVSTSVASAPAAQVAMNFVAGETTETVNSQVRNIIAKDFLKVNLLHLTII